MSTSRDDDPNKPVTGYPYPPPQQHQPQSQSQTNPNNGYPYSHQPNPNYPYTAPPPTNYYTSQPYPSYPIQQPPYDPRRATFLRRMLIIMISIFIIFGVITFIFWLVLRPHVPEFQVSSLSVSGFNISNSNNLSGNWEIELLARNPNKKMSVFYEHVEGYVYYKRENLATTTIAPFSQGTKSETTVKAKFGASGTYVSDYSIKKLNGERSGGNVEFNLRMGGWVRFRSGSWKTRLHTLRIYCDGLTVGLGSKSDVGKLSGGPRKCSVDLLSVAGNRG